MSTRSAISMQEFVEKLLARSQTTGAVLQVALAYIDKLKPIVIETARQCQTEDKEGTWNVLFFLNAVSNFPKMTGHSRIAFKNATLPDLKDRHPHFFALDDFSWVRPFWLQSL